MKISLLENGSEKRIGMRFSDKESFINFNISMKMKKNFMSPGIINAKKTKDKCFFTVEVS